MAARRQRSNFVNGNGQQGFDALAMPGQCATFISLGASGADRAMLPLPSCGRCWVTLGQPTGKGKLCDVMCVSFAGSGAELARGIAGVG